MADINLSFSAEADSQSGFTFVLNTDENGGTNIFAPSSTARLKLYPGGRKPSISLSSGRHTVFLEDSAQSVTEFIVFKNSTEAKLTFPLKKLISASWTGQGNGQPVFSGRTAKLPLSQTGVMKIEYETSYDIIDITSNEPVYVLVTAEGDGMSGMYALDFTDGYDSGLYTRTVILTVKDACTRKTLEGAYVYINGTYAGRSDSTGKVRLGSLKTGTYALKVVKDGYKSTDEDSVRNDSFTVL